VLLTPLATPSRLDAFRGVLLRYAPNGAPGDRASVMAVIARRVPSFLEAKTPGAVPDPCPTPDGAADATGAGVIS
jgi:hypothetical protein